MASESPLKPRSKVERVVWDVVRKPGIRPRKLQKKELAEITSLGSYHGYDVANETLLPVRDGMAEENAELYEIRVAEETIDNPDRYFARRSVTRLGDEIGEYATELWQAAHTIRDARRHGHWFRNAGACMSYGTACEYLGICSGSDTPDSDKWTRRANVHPELDLETKAEGRDLLTNSRIRCFQSCRRKHYYRYEMGLCRADEEDREALYFGSLFHGMLDAWWNAFSGGVNGNCNDRPTNEVDQSAVSSGFPV